MKLPKFVFLTYDDGSVKGYNWAAFCKVMKVAAKDYEKRKGETK